MLSFLLIVSYFVLLNDELRTVTGEEVFTIDTDGCRIPSYPMTLEVLRAVLAPPTQAEINCTLKVIPLLNSNSTHIWVYPPAFDIYQIYSIKEFYCCYRNFSSQGRTDNIGYGRCQEFTTSIKGEHEFVRVECFSGDGKVYEDVFRFNVYKKVPQTPIPKGFNILMFGLDSMSRKNFIRTMPKTSSFLRRKGSVQMYGYSKLGENSFPNLFPMLTGRSFNDVAKNCFKDDIGFNSTGCKFIWDLYKDVGYHTALGADSGIGVLGNYEYQLPYSPTDFYLQPFMYETRNSFKDKTYDYHLCMKDRFVYKELLNFARDVVATVRRNRLFGFFWEESVSHVHVNYPYIMDTEYLSILKEMEQQRDLEDTIVIFFSDHGPKFGEFLETEIGRQESRLPLFEIMFPLRFRIKYKLAYKHIQMNSHRLTTPHDVHQTLLDLLNITTLEDRTMRTRAKNGDSANAGLSLFVPVPPNRTCKSVGVAEHWCGCLNGEIVTIGAKGQVSTAKYLLRHINQIVSEHHQCHKLAIQKILEVTAMKNNDLNQKTYRVLVQTKPGGGMFEGTLVHEHNRWAISGSVSRLNEYRNQSLCIQDPFVKIYCYCRKSTIKNKVSNLLVGNLNIL